MSLTYEPTSEPLHIGCLRGQDQCVCSKASWISIERGARDGVASDTAASQDVMRCMRGHDEDMTRYLGRREDDAPAKPNAKSQNLPKSPLMTQIPPPKGNFLLNKCQKVTYKYFCYLFRRNRHFSCGFAVHGYLAHKKQHPHRTLQ